MYSVAIGFWVYTKTGSSSLMGIMSAISMFVTMFLAPFGGSIVDKCNRKWILVLGDFFQAAIMLTVGAFAYVNKLNVPGVLAAAFLAALGGVFYSPAANTIMIDIIPKDDMVRGQSIFSGCTTLVNLISSSLSGLLVAFFGVPLIIIINGLSNIYAAVSELFVSVPKSVQQGEKITVKGLLNDTKLAVKEIFTEPCLRIFIPCAMILNLLAAGAFSLALPFTAEKGFSVEQYGYFMSIMIAASLTGVTLLSIVKLSSKVRFWVMSLSFIFSEVFMITGYLSRSFAVIGVFIFLGGLLNTMGNSVFNASMLLALPEENKGAILGFISSASVGGSALSALMYGFLGEVFPLYLVFAVCNSISLIPMLYLFLHPRTKEFILTH